MQLGRGFRRLATIADDLEKQGVGVVEATVADDDESTDGTLQVDLRLSVPVSRPEAETGEVNTGESATEKTGQRAGPETRQFEQESGPSEQKAETVESQQTSRPVTRASNEQTAETTEDPAGNEAVIECPFPDCDATFDSEPGMKIHRTKVHLSNGETTEQTEAETPAYRDPEVLAAVYADHDTFPAMREALDADVSTQTIRRHMIKHGIHDPDESSDETGADDETSDDDVTEADETRDETVGVETSATPNPEHSDENEEAKAELLTDGSSLADALPAGIDCPDDVTLEQLRASVEDADTLYDIQQEFDLDREMARDLLSALDLLELVHGRVATRHHREELKAEIDRRIRESIDVSA